MAKVLLRRGTGKCFLLASLGKHIDHVDVTDDLDRERFLLHKKTVSLSASPEDFARAMEVWQPWLEKEAGRFANFAQARGYEYYFVRENPPRKYNVGYPERSFMTSGIFAYHTWIVFEDLLTMALSPLKLPLKFIMKLDIHERNQRTGKPVPDYSFDGRPKQKKQG